MVWKIGSSIAKDFRKRWTCACFFLEEHLGKVAWVVICSVMSNVIYNILTGFDIKVKDSVVVLRQRA